MASTNDVILSTRDARALASLVDDHRASRLEAEAADALAEALMEASMVPEERLPGDRVAMNSRVAYREEPAGDRRSVTLVHPRRANPASGSISVLSPVGRALLGRRRGSTASIDVPGGRALSIRVLDVDNLRLEEAA